MGNVFRLKQHTGICNNFMQIVSIERYVEVGREYEAKGKKFEAIAFYREAYHFALPSKLRADLKAKIKELGGEI